MAVTCNSKDRVRWLSPEEKFKVTPPVIVVEGFEVMEDTVEPIVSETVVEAIEFEVVIPEIVEKPVAEEKIITPKKKRRMPIEDIIVEDAEDITAEKLDTDKIVKEDDWL